MVFRYSMLNKLYVHVFTTNEKAQYMVKIELSAFRIICLVYVCSKSLMKVLPTFIRLKMGLVYSLTGFQS